MFPTLRCSPWNMSLTSQREVGQRTRKRYKGVEGTWLVQGQGLVLGRGLEAKQAAVNPFYVSTLRPVEENFKENILVHPKEALHMLSINDSAQKIYTFNDI